MKISHILPLAFFAALASCDAVPTKDNDNATTSTNALDASAKPAPAPSQSPSKAGGSGEGVYALDAVSLDGDPVNLADYKGKVTLVVNVASQCGYTRQYKGLQALHEEMEERGFAVLGFPSNEFGGQEPGSAAEIRSFCTGNYGVKFPMFSKVVTKKSDGQSPVYELLTTESGSQPQWNFCKYLVGKNGEVLGFYPSRVAPGSPELRAAIEAALD
jgi:glutathione peroxidase